MGGLDINIHGALTVSCALQEALTQMGRVQLLASSDRPDYRARVYVTGPRPGVPEWVVVEGSSLVAASAGRFTPGRDYAGINVIPDINSAYIGRQARSSVPVKWDDQATDTFIAASGGDSALLVFTDRDFPALFEVIRSLMLVTGDCTHGISAGLRRGVADMLDTLRTDTGQMHLPPYLTPDFVTRHAARFRPEPPDSFSAPLLEAARVCGAKWVQEFGSENPPDAEFDYMRMIAGMRSFFEPGAQKSLADLLGQSRDILAYVWRLDEV